MTTQIVTKGIEGKKAKLHTVKLTAWELLAIEAALISYRREGKLEKISATALIEKIANA